MIAVLPRPGTRHAGSRRRGQDRRVRAARALCVPERRENVAAAEVNLATARARVSVAPGTDPILAGAAMGLSSVSVVANSLRLRCFRRP